MPEALQIAATSPLPARASSLPLASPTLGSVPMARAVVGAYSDFLFYGNYEAVDLTFFQTWDVQHIAGIFYLQYFRLEAYSWLISCSPVICSTYGKFV